MAVITKDLGAVSSYALAVENGYTGTEAEWIALISSTTTSAQTAVDAKDAALVAKTAAETAATQAAASATAAASSASGASGSASAAAESATAAAGSATSAGSSATAAAGSATAAAGSASSASGSATAASGSATAASGSASSAATAKTAAEAAQAGAEAAQAAAEAVLESIPEDYSELSDDVSALKSRIESKAEVNGEYDEMTVGSAGQLLSTKGVTDKVPYVFRRSGGNGANRAKVNQIVGVAIAWNQLIQNGNFADNTVWQITNQGTTIDSIASNVLTMTCSAVNSGIFIATEKRHMLFNGHKYLKTADVKSSCEVRVDVDGTNAKYSSGSGNWETLANVFNFGYTSAAAPIYIRLTGTATVFGEVQVKNVMLFDLTQMFGSTIADYIYTLETATAGAGIAKLREWGLLTKDYYAYDAGSLQSVQVAAKKTVGFNQLNFELSKNIGSASVPLDPAKAVRVISGNKYQISFTSVSNATTWRHAIFCFDLNGNRLKSGNDIASNEDLGWNPSGAYYVQASNSTSKTAYFTPLFNGYVMPFLTAGDTTDSTVASGSCLHFVLDGERDGEYEPYAEHVYPLDDSLTLRGIPQLDSSNNLYYDGDVYKADGTVTRQYGHIVLDGSSDESFGLQSINDYGIANFYYQLSGYSGVSDKTQTNRLPWQSTLIAETQTEGYHINSSGVFYIRISSSKASTVDALRTWLASNNVELIYQLATPTTETADPYQETQLLDPYGTEEYVDAAVTAATPTRDVAIPVGHETYYPENATEKLAGLPWDFSTLIATTEKGFTATKAYSVNDFLIVDNQLYKVTSSIANGATITPNTNVTATTLGAQITALLNA